MNEWVNRYANREKSVNGGFWAMRSNVSRSGKAYSKLVKADRSPKASALTLFKYNKSTRIA
jgi:hypothetical protein